MQIWLNSHSGKQNPNQVLCQSISCSIDTTHSPHTRSALQFLPAWRAVSDLVEGETRVNVKLTFPFFPFISWNRNSLFSILSCSGVKWFVSHRNTQSHTEMWNSELKAATGCCCRGEYSLLLTTATKTAESHQSLSQSLQAKPICSTLFLPLSRGSLHCPALSTGSAFAQRTTVCPCVCYDYVSSQQPRLDSVWMSISSQERLLSSQTEKKRKKNMVFAEHCLLFLLSLFFSA